MIKKGSWMDGSYDQNQFLEIFCNHLCGKHEANCPFCILNKGNNNREFWKTPLKDLLIKPKRRME